MPMVDIGRVTQRVTIWPAATVPWWLQRRPRKPRQKACLIGPHRKLIGQRCFHLSLPTLDEADVFEGSVCGLFCEGVIEGFLDVPSWGCGVCGSLASERALRERCSERARRLLILTVGIRFIPIVHRDLRL